MTDRVQFKMSKRSLWLAGMAVAAAVAAGPVGAQPAYRVNIAANGLEPALLSLASQTRQQIFFPKALVSGFRAQALKGSFTPEQALARLLAGTDLRARRVSPHLIVVERPGGAATLMPTLGDDQPQRSIALASTPGKSPDAPLMGSGQRDAPVAASRLEPVLVDEVRVTGSNIRGANPASPLIVLDSADIERSGQTTVADTLKILPQNFGGGATEGANNSGSDRIARNGGYGTAINLRGLGNNATLVLMNGRRMSGSGTFGDFVDISTIPTAAVQRVEVLLDGASAVYGSDAVGGVVNLIMRKDFDGAETRLLGGVGTAGEPAQAQLSQTFGRRWTGGGIIFTYELQRRESLPGRDRAFAATSDLTALGGSDFRLPNAFPGNILLTDPVTRLLVPAYAIPAGQNGVGLRAGDLRAGVINRGNQRQGVDILPKQTLNALYLAIDQDLTDRLEVSADARFSARRYRSHSAPSAGTLTVTRANPFYVSPIGAASQSIFYSLAGDLPNPVASGTVETLGLSAGGVLRLGAGWRAEAYATYAQEADEVRNGGVANTLILSEALGTIADRPETAFGTARDGFYNPFTGIPGSNLPGVVGAIGSGFATNRARSRVSSASLQADGSLWSLPAGDVKLAFGVQARREALFRQGSNFLSTATPVPQVGTDVSRLVTAVFGELRVPLFGPENARAGLQRLDLTLAGRVERYQTFGTTANPKIGVVWAPTEDVRVRASYGRSFRAPALREAFDAPLFTPAQFALGTARLQGLILGGGNRDLKPETATSLTGGVDFKPTRWPGLTLSLSAYDIRFHNRIDRPALSNQANALTDPTLSSFVTRISPATSTADRALISEYIASPFFNAAAGVFPAEVYGAIVDSRYVNTASLHVRGLDVSGAYQFDLGSDHVALAANSAYVFTYDQQVTPTSATFDRVNLVNFPVRFRGRATADWTRGRLTLGGAFNYIGAYRDTLGARIGSQPTFDFQARLSPADRGVTKDLAILFNLRNLLDRKPPFYNNPVGVGFDGANADIIGRFVSLQLTRSW